ncbi:MAG: hypothetical protein JWQ71_2660, partial [Pedosphaera sp.]|nr:hypothetical protein [Pedosphaera sp.]
DFGAVAALFILARVQAFEGANLFPQAKTAGHGFDRHQSGMDGLISVGDEFEVETGFFFGDRWHIFQTITTQINSPKNASSKLIVMIRVKKASAG